jgi:hypothetical protein
MRSALVCKKFIILPYQIFLADNYFIFSKMDKSFRKRNEELDRRLILSFWISFFLLITYKLVFICFSS